MERGNVLVIGNSGVGKSTLINSVLGEEKAVTSIGTEGTTKHLELYDNPSLPFRLIDTAGFEPSFFKKRQAVGAVRKWSRDSAKKGNINSSINVIWFCVDGMSSKLFPDTLKCLSEATSMWESVPVIVVITKSFSNLEKQKNIEMVQNAFAKQKYYSKNLKKIIPVVASPLILNDTAFAPPEGVTELIDATNELMPEGIRAAKKDINKYNLARKDALAHTIVAASATSAAVAGAIPVGFIDIAVLYPMEIKEIDSIAAVYGIEKSKQYIKFRNSIVDAGTMGFAAKELLSKMKVIPGLKISTSILNAVVASAFACAVGEASLYAFRQIYLGKKTENDIDWITEVVENILAGGITDKVILLSQSMTGKEELKTLGMQVLNLLTNKKNPERNEENAEE